MAITNLPQLEYFDFKGKFDQDRVNGFSDYIKTKTMLLPQFQTLLPSEMFQTLIVDMRKALNSFGLSLGYNLANRISYLDRVVFAKKDDFIKSNSKWKENFRAVFDRNNFKIYVSVDKEGVNRDRGSMAHSLNHEFVHSISYHEIVFSEHEHTWEVPKSGFKKVEKFFILDEGMTEITNLFVINRFWPKFTASKEYVDDSNCEVSHPNDVLFIDAIISELAEKSSQSYEEILSIMHKDMLTGTENALGLIDKLLGENIINTLLNVRAPVDYSTDFLLEMARKHQLMKFKGNIEKDVKTNELGNIIRISKIGATILS